MAVSNDTLDEVVVAIRDDLIGGAADMSRETARALSAVAVESEAQSSEEVARAIEEAVDRLLAVTPSIAPVLNVMHAAMTAVEDSERLSVNEVRDRVVRSMTEFRSRLGGALATISAIGAELIHDGDSIFTYSISTTVWGIFRQAKAQGKDINVIVTESRPGNEGLWNIAELGKVGIPVTVGIDAAMGTLMRGCAMFVVGSDGITSTGDALCKIGTYPAAAVARDLGIPVRIAADMSKFDPLSLLGFSFKIREMPLTDIVQETAPNLTVRNPVFDVTPARLIDGIITERGIISSSAAYSIFSDMRQSARLSHKLRTWIRQKA